MTSPHPLPSDFSLVQPTPPEITPAHAARIAAERFGLDATASSLGSHQDRNFLLEHAGGRALLKIANPSTTVRQLEAQSLVARILGERESGIRIPLTRPGRDGADVQAIEVDGQVLHARLLDFLEGAPLSGTRYLSPAAVRAIGRLAGRVGASLADVDLPGLERAHQWDLRQAPTVLKALLPFVGEVTLRERLRTAAEAAWATVSALADRLPVQLVHGDLTDDNVVSEDGATGIPDGVIDFGDLNRSWAIGELAVTVASLLHHTGTSVATAMRAVAAYHAVRPISAVEADALWPLVVLRSAVLVASGHHVQATDPDNRYATDNLRHELVIFERATALPAAVLGGLVGEATGRAPARLALPAFTPLLPGLSPADIAILDLSATSPALHGGRWLRPRVEAEIAAEALGTGTAATLTRFAEPRLTRSRIPVDPEPCNTVLGIELRVTSTHEVVAPWSGTVSNTADGLSLRAAGLVLTLDGVESRIADGTSIAAGAALGLVPEALRIQIAREGTEPPWIVTPTLTGAWAGVLADPTPLLLGEELAPDDRDPAALLERRRRSFADAQEYYYEDPPIIVRGWQEYLVDVDGRVWLDVLNNVTSIGHAHPRLVAAVNEQWQLLNTNSRFNYPAVVEFSERLGALMPEGLSSVFLVNSGSEAVDLALRIARAWSGRRDVVAMREAYHGWTDLSDAVSTSVADNPDALGTRPEWIHTVDAPNTYRGVYRGADAGRYATDAVAEFERLAAAGTPAGAFIAESYYGNAGGIALPAGYLEATYAAVRAHGGLAVADEVQVGYGRLGEWFWGFEQQGVVPDIVAVAKAMGNGHPLGAVITTPEIAEQYRSQGYFFSSSGGSPVSSVVGLTVLDVIREERLQQNAVDVGGYLRSRLEELCERHPIAGAVHGDGFYLGLEFVRDSVTLEPATEETTAICNRLRELGVVVQPTSDRQCVLKIKPPMCLTRVSADAFVAALDEVLTTGW